VHDWLHYFFLSFFTDKYTHQAHKRSILNAFGCYFLSLIILAGLLMGGYMAAMPSHYSEADSYRQALYSVLGNTDHIIKIENGFFSFTDEQNNVVVINTLADETADTCEFIIDTRDIKNIYVEFSIQYTNQNGTTLSYEEYLTLSEEEKKDYTFSANYTDTPINFNDELLSSYAKTIEKTENDEIHKQYTDLIDHKQELSQEEYSIALYELYVKAYYPSNVQSLDLYSIAPTLYTYYEHLTVHSGDIQFFTMYRHWAYSRFVGDKDIRYLISGTPDRLGNHLLTQQDAEATKANIDRFIIRSFQTSGDRILLEYIFNFINLSSLLIIGSLLLTILPWLLFKIAKKPTLPSYFASFKILYLYTPIAAVISGFTGYALSWSAGRSTAYRVAVLCFIAIVACRLTIYTLRTLYRAMTQPTE